MLYLSEDLFLVLARDNNRGRAQESTESIYRHADIYSIKGATNILGLYDGPTDAIANPNTGALNPDIIPATHYDFIDFNNNTELAKFGHHNGGDDDSTLLNEKWEGLELIPVECTTDEFYLLTVSDDDFITQNGFMDFG
ncbi:unnamed protein product [[Candida] boidinii]|nr:unnamed protein product [[Candida] boidinii]